jgi:hypothetical protein
VRGRANIPEHIQGTYLTFSTRTTLLPGKFGFSRTSLWYLFKEE